VEGLTDPQHTILAILEHLKVEVTGIRFNATSWIIIKLENGGMV
jgi:hypothetical protein